MDKHEWEGPEASKPTECLVCEAMLPDAVDGLLSEAEQRAFDKHIATCAVCSEELEQAQRGAAWLQMLKGHAPEPSPLLLSKILAQTTGADAAAAPLLREEAAHEWATRQTGATQKAPATDGLMMMPDGTIGRRPVAPVRANGLMAFTRRKLVDIFSIQKATMHFQPRLAMTAAMAFFSVALTLNMTGVKLASLKTANLRPSSLRRAVADTSASAMRSFQNMRVVYQFESKLEDIRDTSSSPQRTPSDGTPQENSTPSKSKPNSGHDGNKQNTRGHSALEFPLARKSATEQGV